MITYRWSRWHAAEECTHCGFITRRMVVYSYTCPKCGVHDSYPRHVAIRIRQRVFFGIIAFGTVEYDVKPAIQKVIK